ncbi:hypothetical protein HYZ97_02625 [Candidatus Pacearchaeota archaeon]|nr:hypothetical protein [Candidatus Pacearchaeota archaeon]
MDYSDSDAMRKAIKERAAYSLRVRGIAEAIERIDMEMDGRACVEQGEVTHAEVLLGLLSRPPQHHSLRRYHESRQRRLNLS